MSILVNGEVIDYFHPSRVIRQEVPISPYIFILFVQFLSIMIEEEVRDKRWTPIQIERNGPLLTYSFFGDDIVVFRVADNKTMLSVKKVLKTFCK